MTETLLAHDALTVFFVLCGMVAWWRLTNTRVSLSWEATTTSNDGAIIKALRKESAERGEAVEYLQREAERMRKP